MSNSPATPDQLLEVLHAPLGLERALGLERVEVAGVVEDRLEELGDGVALGPLAQAGHDGREARDGLDRRGAKPRHGLGARHDVPDVLARRVDVGQDAALGLAADPAARRVDDAGEGDRVGRVGEERQVGDRVLHLGALVELGAADHLVGHLVADERVLEDAALRVHPVEDRDVVAPVVLVGDQALDLTGDVARLRVLVVELGDHDRLAAPRVRPEVLLLLLGVVRDDRVRGVEDRPGRAIVLLELHHLGPLEVMLELQDVANVGRSEV